MDIVIVGVRLMLPDGSSWWATHFAQFVLVVHVGAGVICLVSGAAALVLRKGTRRHRIAGRYFVLSMLATAVIGASAGPFLHEPKFVVAGSLATYLVATGWATMWRKEGTVGRFEIGAACVALCVAAGCVLLAIQTAKPTAYVGLAISLLAGAGDIKAIVRGGVFGAARVARHLWRMCAAFLLAAVSFFLGQPQFFPPSIRGSRMLAVPELLVAGAMIFWLIRIRFTMRLRRPTADC